MCDVLRVFLSAGQGRAIHEKSKLRKTFLEKIRRKLKLSSCDRFWLRFEHYFRLSCESKRVQGRCCPSDRNTRGWKILNPSFSCLVFISWWPLLEKANKGMGMLYHDEKRNAEARPRLDSVPFRAGITLIKPECNFWLFNVLRSQCITNIYNQKLFFSNVFFFPWSIYPRWLYFVSVWRLPVIKWASTPTFLLLCNFFSPQVDPPFLPFMFHLD